VYLVCLSPPPPFHSHQLLEVLSIWMLAGLVHGCMVARGMLLVPLKGSCAQMTNIIRDAALVSIPHARSVAPQDNNNKESIIRIRSCLERAEK
jgi:hypothetical protein